MTQEPMALVSPELLRLHARTELERLVRELLGIGREEPLRFSDDVVLAYEVGLASIEVVALLDGVHERLGVDIYTLCAAQQDMLVALEHVSVGWVVEHAVRARRASGDIAHGGTP